MIPNQEILSLEKVKEIPELTYAARFVGTFQAICLCWCLLIFVGHYLYTYSAALCKYIQVRHWLKLKIHRVKLKQLKEVKIDTDTFKIKSRLVEPFWQYHRKKWKKLLDIASVVAEDFSGNKQSLLLDSKILVKLILL